LHPWRKGPFHIMGVDIDTEWRSDWKWQRLEHCLGDLTGLNLLDVGCGSGYHVLRMLGAGANSVIGIEPTLLYVAQFLALQHFAQQEKAVVLPYSLEALGNQVAPFDLVFSCITAARHWIICLSSDNSLITMGVCYWKRWWLMIRIYWFRQVAMHKCVMSGLSRPLTN